MSLLIYITISIIALFILERVVLVPVTQHPRLKEYVRNCWLLHPNSLSAIRLPMGIFSVLLWFIGWPVAAIINVAFWMITDLSDGTIARNCGLVTDRGKWLDPLSDKCLYFPPLAAFAVMGKLPTLTIAALIVIDILGQFSRFFVKKKAANLFGKLKTALITILLALTAAASLPTVTEEITFLTSEQYQEFLALMALSCLLLAFLSFYCKMVPDSWYANSLTTVNFLCGIAAIYHIFNGFPFTGFIIIFVGQFFDLFDGRLARKYGSTRHGAVYDDIADGTNFGFAVGILIWSRLADSAGTILAAAAGIIYFGCVVYRLIRFVRTKQIMAPGVFQGLPSPGGALLAGSAVLLFPKAPVVASGVVLLTSLLMVSSVHYLHFAKEIWPNLPNFFKLIAAVLFLLFVNKVLVTQRELSSFALVIFVMALIYLMIGLEAVAYRAPFFQADKDE